MNSLKDKIINTETVFIGSKAYRFEITGESITRYGLKSEETSNVNNLSFDTTRSCGCE